MSLFSRLAGTLASFFQVGGPTGPGFNANVAALEARNATNTGFAVTRGAPPVGANDFVTLGSLTSLAGVANVIRFAITNGAAQNSVTALPAGAVVLRAFLDISVAYSAGTTITVGTAAFPHAFLDTGDSDPQATNIYDAPQDTVSAAGGTVLVTVAGAPAAGSGFCCVEYVEPLP